MNGESVLCLADLVPVTLQAARPGAYRGELLLSELGSGCRLRWSVLVLLSNEATRVGDERLADSA